MFSAGFVSMILNVLTIAGILIWLLVMSPKLGLIILTVMPFLFATVGYYSGRLRVSYRNARSRLSALNAFLAENILGMRVVQLFGREALHLERFDRLNAWYMEAQKNTVRVFALFQPSITLAQGTATTLLLYFGAESALKGEIQPGVLVAFFSYVATLFQPMRELADKWNIFLSGMASAERIFGLLEWKPEDGPAAEFVEPQEALPYQELQGEIVFDQVWFAYEGEKWVLKNFSLKVRPGERIGVVGHTGAGKSTLISLLLRFREPQRGRILLDGRDLRDYDRRSLRASIGMVQQDVFLFSGSIEENVHLWRPQVLASNGEASIRERLASLGLDVSERELELELDERGGNLSAGQRQLLAFERARSQNPRLWILDEATSNIDSETEHRVVSEFDGASRGKTCFLIAHRLATVRTCNRILVLHRGELVECGTHQELIQRDGLYARLYRFQTSSEELETRLAHPDSPQASPAT
jgi:ABC-type multidrug transport system fused ATPase/permease subunit